jgi:hypothetical protein
LTTTTPTNATDRLAPPDSGARDLLRHTIATLAYRAAKAIRGARADFGAFSVAPGSRTPSQILAHLGDLFDWANSLVRGEWQWNDSTPGAWDDDVARFFAGLERLDAYLASGAPLKRSSEQIFQGPIADALTHVGQLTLLRRIAGNPIRGESYARAEITRGRVRMDQAAPKVEFD